MYAILKEQVAVYSLEQQVVRVVRLVDYSMPSGMLASIFTEAGQLLGSNGSGSPVVVPPPTAEGQILRARLAETLKMIWESVDLSQLVQTAVKTAAYTAINNDHVRVDASGAGADFEVALPATPATGNKVRVTMVDEHATYKVTIGRNGSLVNGGTSTTAYSLVNAGDTVYFEYTGATLGWVAVMWNKALDTLTGASANGQSLVTAADYSAMRTLLGLVIGTNVQAWDADLDGWAGKTPPSGAVVGTTDTQTMTNKRNTKRTVTVTAGATPSINTDNGDIFSITGLATAITSLTTNLTGTPNANDMMMIEITDDGTARAITCGASFVGTAGNELPTTTLAGKKMITLWKWSSALSKWQLLGKDDDA